MAIDEPRLNRIEHKVDQISDRLGDTNIILAAQHESLKEHMRRSELLEEAIKPLQRHVSMVEGAMKLVSIIAAIVSILAFILYRKG